MKDIKIDTGKLLTIGVTVLGLAGTILSNKLDDDRQLKLKEDLKKEILDDLHKND